jgi:hypothetical protein
MVSNRELVVAKQLGLDDKGVSDCGRLRIWACLVVKHLEVQFGEFQLFVEVSRKQISVAIYSLYKYLIYI